MKEYGFTPERLYQTWFYETMGKRIKSRRKNQGETQEDLADALGISRVSMVNIENGKQRLPIHIINDICTLLKTNINALVPNRNEYTPAKDGMQEGG